MRVQNGERRPASFPSGEMNPGEKFESTLTHRPDIGALTRRREYAVRVWAERADGVLTEQLYASIDAATAKVRRTHERGLNARVELVRVVPVCPLDDGAVV